LYIAKQRYFFLFYFFFFDIKVMPALSAFCIYAAAGIIAVFFLQLTIFVPFMAIDEARADSRRDACLPCCVRLADDYDPSDCSQRPLLSWFFGNYFAPFVLSFPAKVRFLFVCFCF
jgi:hypothetical protein